MAEKLKILFIEDDLSDLNLICHYIARSDIQFERQIVTTEYGFIEALTERQPDIILSDFSLPQFNGLQALKIRNEINHYVPFILITGAVDDEIAVECMKLGADDYLLKKNLTRVGHAIISAIEKKRAVREKEIAEKNLIESEKRNALINNSTLDFILSYDLTGRITYANRAFCEALGMSYEQVTGRRNQDLGLRPEDSRQFDSAIHDVILKGESLRRRIKFSSDNSGLRHYDAYIHPIFNFSCLLIGISAILRDITDIINYEEMLRNSRDELRELSRKMESIREMERKEIAINLHDDLGQKLTILKMGLNMLKTGEKTGDAGFIEKVNDLMHMVDDTVKIVHRISSDLRPSLLYDFGLQEALKYHLEEFSGNTAIKYELSIIPDDLKMDEELSVVAFRIIQESLTNTARHSKAEKVKVVLRLMEEDIFLEISDDGIGIRESDLINPNAFGLTGIRERARIMGGKAEITGIPGSGTTVKVTIPLKKIIND